MLTLITLELLMTLSAAPTTGPAPVDLAPPGASAFFSSSHPSFILPRRDLAAGRFESALQRLDKIEQNAPAHRGVCEEAREIIRRTRADYSLDAEGLLKRLRASIPDVTPDDLERWTKAGQVQHRVIDGRRWYFRREPANVFRFCPEAIERRQGAGKAPPSPMLDKQKLLDHINAILQAADASGESLVVPIRHHVTYRVTVPAGRAGAKKGSVLRCWLPFPQEYRQQTDVKLLRTSPEKHQITPGADDRGRVKLNAQRAVYLEQTIDDPEKPVTFEEEFEYVCRAYCPKLEDEKAAPLDRTDLGLYLQERPPHIAFTPELRQKVEEIVGTETNPLRKVRRIYHWIDANIRYCAEEEYCNLPSFSGKALATGKGDCGVFATLFITMCRDAGVPARWQSGFETKPWGDNMHDWAEFYVAPWGWLPADMSYGLQPSDDPRVREFYIGHLDAYRMIVNLDYGSPLVPEKKSLRSEPADFQRGEVELDGRNLYFDEWSYDMKYQYEPLTGR